MDHYLIHPLPNPYTLKDLVPKYLRMWHNLPNYSQQEIILKDLFRKYPHNDNKAEVMAKFLVLNEFYSTSVLANKKMVEHIVSISDIDYRLQEGHISVVDDIKNPRSINRNFISFASKYSSFHNPEAFPIFDSFVADVLSYYQNNYFFWRTNEHLSTEVLRKLQYVKFYDIIEKFKKTFIPEHYTYKELDRFLWQMGKEYFVDYKLAKVGLRYVIVSKSNQYSIYELCMHLTRNALPTKVGDEYIAIATDRDFDFAKLMLSRHRNYVSRKDGLIGDYYVDIDDKETTIRVYRTTYDSIAMIDNETNEEKEKLIKIEKKKEDDLAGTLYKIANNSEISNNGSFYKIKKTSYNDVCKEIVNQYYKQHFNANNDTTKPSDEPKDKANSSKKVKTQTKINNKKQ